MNSQNISHDWKWARLACRRLRIAWKNVVGQALRLPKPRGFQFSHQCPASEALALQWF